MPNEALLTLYHRDAVNAFVGCIGARLIAQRDSILSVVRSHKGQAVHVFGSVAQGTESPESDLDLLVTFEEDASLFDQVRLQNELETFLGCNVDVLSMSGLLQGRDGKGQYRRERILREAVPL